MAATAYFSSLDTLQGVLDRNVDLPCRSVRELMELKNSQWQFYREAQNSELACSLARRGKGTSTAM